MATRMKTIEYVFPTFVGPSANGGTYNTFSTKAIYIPETVSSFISVTARYTMADVVTVTGSSIPAKSFEFQLGSVAYTAVSNNEALNNSGENIAFFWDVDFTSYFNTNWSGTSMNSNTRFSMTQSGGTTFGFNNCCCVLRITYTYDDTSVIQIKSVRIPLNTSNAAISTAPISGAPVLDTIPALSTYLPENSKTFRDISVTFMGNENRAGTTTDLTLYANIGTVGLVSAPYEGALSSDRCVMYSNTITSVYPNTGATQDFKLAASAANFHHMQAWMTVTYEFDASNTTSCMNSIMLPFCTDFPGTGYLSVNFDRHVTTFYIQEPGTITASRITPYFYISASSDPTPGVRIGVPGISNSAGWIMFNAAADTTCGCFPYQLSPNSNITLSRGLNKLYFDAYRTTQTNINSPINGFWVINYTSNIASSGIGSHNHTVFEVITTPNSRPSILDANTVSLSATIPETEYYINNAGIEHYNLTSGTGAITSQYLNVERNANELDGKDFFSLYSSPVITDTEIGARFYYTGKGTDFFKRWPTDTDPSRVDIETSRRYYYGGSGTSSTFDFIHHMTTYHSISYTISGTISNSNGSSINIDAYQTSGQNNFVGLTTRTGNGSFSMTWYDNTIPVIVTAYENSSFKGMSQEAVAGSTFDISLAGGGGGGPTSTYYAFA